MIAWLEFATGGHAGLWLPLLLLLELNLLRSKRNILVVPIAAVFFFIYTAGDFQVPLYITSTYLLLALYKAFFGKSNYKKKLRVVLIALVLGIMA